MAYAPLSDVAFEPPETPNARRVVAVAQFRLMCLQPGSEDSPVHFSFSICSARNSHQDKLGATSDGPDYEAISYTWLGDSSVRTIWCDGEPVKVSSVVHEMLLHLRQPDRMRWLWIDAICIDQSNLRERASQVTIMRLIYSAAQRTLVWLGPPTANARLLAPAVERLTEARKRLGLAPGQDPNLRHGGFLRLSKLKRELGLPSTSSKDRNVNALVSLLECGYFSRVWIIQEITVSENIFIVQGHDVQIPWSAVSAAILFVYHLRMDTDWSPTMSSSLARLTFLHAQQDLYRRRLVPNLRILLNMYRHAKATDPRDKIYALAGISNCWDSCVPDLMSYEKSFADVYRIWTIILLEKENSLEILSAAHRYSRSADLDVYSWVPDWSFAGDTDIKHVAGWPAQHLQATNASKLIVSKSTFSPDFTRLGIDGYIIGRIQAAGVVMSQENMPVLGPKVFWSARLQYLHWMYLSYHDWSSVAQIHRYRTYSNTGEDMLDALRQTLSYGEACSSADFAAWRRHYHLPSILPWPFWLISLFIVLYIRVVFRFKDDAGHWRFQDRWSTAAGWRRMIRTETGFIGLASHGVEVGDYVGLFRGGRMPLVLKRDGDGEAWRLTGDAYVHGAMNGEAWSEAKCERFWIR